MLTTPAWNASVASSSSRPLGPRRSLAENPRGAIAEVGGFEIVAMAGFFLEARHLGLTIVLDGMIATAAALIAETLRPGTAGAMIAAHLSAEPAHALMLAKLGLEPLLTDWQLCLGEATGALLAMPLLRRSGRHRDADGHARRPRDRAHGVGR